MSRLWRQRFVPDGYVMVPVDPTLEMRMAGRNAFLAEQYMYPPESDLSVRFDQPYKAMIEAARAAEGETING